MRQTPVTGLSDKRFSFAMNKLDGTKGIKTYGIRDTAVYAEGVWMETRR
jgi:hypothetical protein